MKSKDIEGIVKGVVRELYSKYPGVDWEDLEAQGWLLITESVPKFDPSRGCTMNTYLYGALRYGLQDYLRRDVLQEDNLNGLRDHIDYQEEVIGSLDHADASEALIVLKQMYEESSGVSRDVLKYMLLGYTQAEVARELKVSRQRVSEIIMELRRKYGE